MKLETVFPSKYIKASDLLGKDVTLTIRNATLEEMGHGAEKTTNLVCWFERTEKGLIVNRTNGGILGKLHGTETDDWKGKRIIIYPTTVRAFGATHDVIRIRETVPPPAVKKPEVAAAPVEEPTVDDPEDYMDTDDGDDQAVAAVIVNPFEKAQPFYESVLLHLEGKHLEIVEWTAKVHERSSYKCKPVTFEMIREMLKPYCNGHFLNVLSILCQDEIDEENRPGEELANALIRFVPDVIPLADGREQPNKDHNANLIATLRHLANVDVEFSNPQPIKETA